MTLFSDWPVRWVVMGVLLAVAVVFDLRQRRIPNWLVGLGAVLGVGVNAWGGDAIGAGAGLIGLLVGFMVLLPFYLLRAMGAGDVKLMAVVGLLVGYPKIVFVLVYTFLAGGVLGVVLAVAKNRGRKLAENMGNILRDMALWVMARERPARMVDETVSVGKMPYSLAIAVGVGLALFWGPH